MFTISYGLFVLTARTTKDNGCIVNTVQQITQDPLKIAVAVNKSIQLFTLVGDVHLGLQGFALMESLRILQRDIRLFYGGALQAVYEVFAVAMTADGAGIQGIAMLQVSRIDNLATITVVTIDAYLAKISETAVIGSDIDLGVTIANTGDQTVCIHGCH